MISYGLIGPSPPPYGPGDERSGLRTIRSRVHFWWAWYRTPVILNPPPLRDAGIGDHGPLDGRVLGCGADRRSGLPNC
jgi:hypothetical protein